MQQLTLVKIREKGGVEGMEQGMRAVMFEEGAVFKRGLIRSPWFKKAEGIVGFLEGMWGGNTVERLLVTGMCRASCLGSSQICSPFAFSTVQEI